MESYEMPQAHQEDLDAEGGSDPRDSTRATRAKSVGSPEESAAGTSVPSILTVDNLRHVGRTLNGAHWQADVAALIGCSKSQVTRFLNGQRDLNPLLSHHLQYVIVERIEQLIDLLHVEGMPYAGSQKAEEAIRAVQAAVAQVPGQEPPRDR